MRRQQRPKLAWTQVKGGGKECTGPSLAFVRLRRTKDCTQDDNRADSGVPNSHYFWAALVEGIWIAEAAGATYTTSPGRV